MPILKNEILNEEYCSFFQALFNTCLLGTKHCVRSYGCRNEYSHIFLGSPIKKGSSTVNKYHQNEYNNQNEEHKRRTKWFHTKKKKYNRQV